MGNREVVPIDRGHTENTEHKRGRKPKKNGAFTSKEIIQKMAKSNINTSLTQSQLEEAIYVFCRFIAELFLNPEAPEKLTISLPSLGKFMYKRRKGLKKGDTYKAPKDFGKIKTDDGKAKIETILVEEDRLDYRKMWFAVSPTLQQRIKEASNEYYSKHGDK